MKKRGSNRRYYFSNEPALDAKLLAYCAMLSGSLAAAQPADAAVVYSGIKNLTVSSGNEVAIDLDDNGTAEFRVFYGTRSGEISTLWYFRIASAVSSAQVLNEPATMTSPQIAQNIPIGGNISKALSLWEPLGNLAWFSTSTTMSFNGSTTVVNTHKLTGGNFAGKKGLIGVRFPAGGSTHYGWIRFETNSDITEGTVIDWAYESVDNASITAGAGIPTTTSTTTTAPPDTTSTTTTTTTTIPEQACTFTVQPPAINPLLSRIEPLGAFLLRIEHGAKFPGKTDIQWGTDAVQTLFKIPIARRFILAVVLFKPEQLTPGETYEVRVGDCTGELTVRSNNKGDNSTQ